MFEKGKPVARAFCDADPESSGQLIVEMQVSSHTGHARSARVGDALRAIEWSELAARLNAARELRRELRHEAILCAGATGAKFGDAAAGFFNSVGLKNTIHSERPVNPDGLEASKGSACTASQQGFVGAEGDVRED